MPSTKSADPFNGFPLQAVVPEDVPVAMPTLELVWRAHRQGKELSRIERFHLRSHAFALLDVGLLLGETQGGVYMPHV